MTSRTGYTGRCQTSPWHIHILLCQMGVTLPAADFLGGPTEGVVRAIARRKTSTPARWWLDLKDCCSHRCRAPLPERNAHVLVWHKLSRSLSALAAARAPISKIYRVTSDMTWPMRPLAPCRIEPQPCRLAAALACLRLLGTSRWVPVLSTTGICFTAGVPQQGICILQMERRRLGVL